MQCFFQFWGKARAGLLDLYKMVSTVQRRNRSHNTKYNTYSCLWSAVKLCSETAVGWSYPYFLSTMDLEMCCVILSTGLCFCATWFIRPPRGLFGETFWVFYCPWHFRTFINWCRMKGRCFTMPFLLLVWELYFCYHLAKIFLAFLHIMSGEVISRLYARKNKKCPWPGP